MCVYFSANLSPVISIIFYRDFLFCIVFVLFCFVFETESSVIQADLELLILMSTSLVPSRIGMNYNSWGFVWGFVCLLFVVDIILYCVNLTGLKFTTFLPHPPKFWDSGQPSTYPDDSFHIGVL